MDTNEYLQSMFWIKNKKIGIPLQALVVLCKSGVQGGHVFLMSQYRSGKFWSHDLFEAILMKRTFTGAGFERGPLKPYFPPILHNVGKFKNKSVGETKKTNGPVQKSWIRPCMTNARKRTATDLNEPSSRYKRGLHTEEEDEDVLLSDAKKTLKDAHDDRCICC